MVAAVLAAVAGLLSAWWAAHKALPAWLAEDHAGSAAPMLVLLCTEHDFGTVSQGVVVRTAFLIRNAGNRRLVLFQEQERCCGQLSDLPPVIVAAGQTEELAVEVDTGQWYGRMERTISYTTNDPIVPRFGLKVTADVGDRIPVSTIAR